MAIQKTQANPLVFPAPLPYRTENDSLNELNRSHFTRQIKAFYHHCQVYGQVIDLFHKNLGSHSGYSLNLTNKNITWEEPQARKVTATALEVRICKQSSDNARIQYWSFIFKDKKESYCLEQKQIPTDKIPLAAMAGDEVEVIGHCQSAKEDTSFWVAWKDRDLSAADNYRQVIYPIFIGTVSRIFEVLQRPLRIADIAGSDGELSLTLAENGFVEKIILVDNNSQQIELAKARTTCTCSFRSPEAKKKVSAQSLDITHCDFSTIFKEPIDVIILSGVMAMQVLTREESSNLLKACKPFLAKDGYILVASYSPKYFSNSHYEEMGFSVLNASVHLGDLIKGTLEPFYILQAHQTSTLNLKETT